MLEHLRRLRWITFNSYAASLVWLFIFSLGVIDALRYATKFNRLGETFLFLVFLHRLTQKGLMAAMGICVVLVALYHPTAVLYGRPNYGIIASLASTHTAEALEYMRNIPLHIYADTVIRTLVLSWMAWHIPHIPTKKWGWKTASALLLLASTMVGNSLHKGYACIKGECAVRVMPIEFMADMYYQPKAYLADMERIRQSLNEKDSWRIKTIHQPYRNYVLVVGESARADYMSVYGYPLDTTPFARQQARVVMEKALSPGPNTPISLMHTLAIPDGKDFDIRNNIVTLANRAGMETVWLSNQGRVGTADTSISMIAQHANKQHFLKTYSYDFGAATYDDALLPVLADALKEQAQKNRLVVVHLLGSHPHPCARLRQAPPDIKPDDKDINCYIESIRQTDQLLQNIYMQLQQTGLPFSMLYFSDHGLRHDHLHISPGRQTSLRHDDAYWQNYHIPFLIFNSDLTPVSRHPGLRSGFYLMNGIVQWLGIKTENLPAYDYFAHASQPGDSVQVLTLKNALKSVTTLKDDPAWIPPHAP